MLLSSINERTKANLVLHMYAAANTVMTVNRILMAAVFGSLKNCIGRTWCCFPGVDQGCSTFPPWFDLI
jgi:hypothetical protein